MPVIYCPSCKASYEIDNDDFNKDFECPACREIFSAVDFEAADKHPILDIDKDADQIAAYNYDLQIKKAVQELQGIAAAIIYDGKIENSEIQLLAHWLIHNKQYIDTWPIGELAANISKLVKTKTVAAEDRNIIFNLLSKFAAGPEAPETVQGIFDECDIIFENRNFLFTGRLKYGLRKKAESAVKDRRGKIGSDVNFSLDYLIVGDLGNDSWKYSRFGRKIENAIKMREQTQLKILRESDFIKAIMTAAEKKTQYGN